MTGCPAALAILVSSSQLNIIFITRVKIVTFELSLFCWACQRFMSDVLNCKTFFVHHSYNRLMFSSSGTSLDSHCQSESVILSKSDKNNVSKIHFVFTSPSHIHSLNFIHGIVQWGRYHQQPSSQLITLKSQVFPVKSANLQSSGLVGLIAKSSSLQN